MRSDKRDWQGLAARRDAACRPSALGAAGASQLLDSNCKQRSCKAAAGSGEEWDEWVSEGKKSPFLGPYVPNDPEAPFRK